MFAHLKHTNHRGTASSICNKKKSVKITHYNTVITDTILYVAELKLLFEGLSWFTTYN